MKYACDRLSKHGDNAIQDAVLHICPHVCRHEGRMHFCGFASCCLSLQVAENATHLLNLHLAASVDSECSDTPQVTGTFLRTTDEGTVGDLVEVYSCML